MPRRVGPVTGALVWIDCEMTGLDLTKDALVEVAALVTDGQLNVLGEGIDLLIRPPDEAVEGMDDFVKQMHASSGLSQEWASGTTLEDAQARVLEYIREHVPDARTAPMAGNTICTDRAFLARDMPQLEAHVHYRNVDVSSIKELARRWYPKAYNNAPRKAGNHRALTDIQESIEELRYYRETIFTATPQPTKSMLRAIAIKYTGSVSRNDT